MRKGKGKRKREKRRRILIFGQKIHSRGGQQCKQVSCCYGTTADSFTAYLYQPAPRMRFKEWLACAWSKAVCCQYIISAENTVPVDNCISLHHKLCLLNILNLVLNFVCNSVLL